MQILYPECHVYIIGIAYLWMVLTGKYIVSITLVAKFRTIIQYNIHLYLKKGCIVGDLRLTQHVSSSCTFSERAHDIHC